MKNHCHANKNTSLNIKAQLVCKKEVLLILFSIYVLFFMIYVFFMYISTIYLYLLINY